MLIAPRQRPLAAASMIYVKKTRVNVRNSGQVIFVEPRRPYFHALSIIGKTEAGLSVRVNNPTG